MNFKNIFTVALLIFMSLVTLRSLLWSVNPHYFNNEISGSHHFQGPGIADLCSPKILDGIKGPNSNVTDQRTFSIFYAFLDKVIWKNVVENYFTIHRAFHGLVYFLILFFLLLIAYKLKWTTAFIGFFLVYFGFSEQVLGYFFEHKFSLLSVLWLVITIYLAIIWHQIYLKGKTRNKSDSWKFKMLNFLLPLVLFLSYETYVVSRTVAAALLGYFLFINSYFLFKSKLPKIDFSIFIAGMGLAILIFAWIHPGIKYDLSIFEGRGEALVDGAGQIRNDFFKNLAQRLAEAPQILQIGKHSIFETEFAHQTGWLEIIIFLILSLILTKGLPKKNPLLLLMLAIILVVGLVTPLLSTTYIRGHRFFPFYLSSLLLTLILFHEFYQRLDLKLKKITSSMLYLCTLAILIHRTPHIINYQQPIGNPHANPPHFDQLVRNLTNINITDKMNKDNFIILVCDQIDMSYSNWVGAFRLSDLGCKLEIDHLDVNCQCGPMSDRNIVCFKRTKGSTKNEIETEIENENYEFHYYGTDNTTWSKIFNERDLLTIRK